jgi:hypothetical protein
MTEGNMTGRPYGGVNDTSGQGDVLPSDRPVQEEAEEASPQQSQRAAEHGGMTSGAEEGLPLNAGSPDSAGPPDTGSPH